MNKCEFCTYSKEESKYWSFRNNILRTGHSLEKDRHSLIAIDLDTNELLIDLDCYIVPQKIKYCPACGRKLGDDTNDSQTAKAKWRLLEEAN